MTIDEFIEKTTEYPAVAFVAKLFIFCKSKEFRAAVGILILKTRESDLGLYLAEFIDGTRINNFFYEP